MKIIAFESLAPVAEADFLPDSALLLPGRPMFYPESGAGWHLVPFTAVRLNRLGKGVAPKFATRYYDALAPALRLVLPGCQAPGLLSGMDASVVCGAWMEPHLFGSRLDALCGDHPLLFTAGPDAIAAAIAAVSRLTTVKMGDIILLPSPSAPIPATPRTRITLTAPSHPDPLLGLKIV